MKYELIMENWRKYVNEQGLSKVRSRLAKASNLLKGGGRTRPSAIDYGDIDISSTKKLSYNEQDVFTKHIKDNVPIAKDIALDIIKKNPDVAVKATNVYRGMRVSKEYIIKHYGAQILSKGPGTHVLEVSKKFSPRKGTSSWAIDSDEAGAWAGGYGHKKSQGTIGILFVGGKGPKDVGLDITKRAKQIGSKQSHFDWSEVSMLGDVEVHKVIITVGDAPKGKMHFPPSKLAANDNIAPGFYEPQTRGELVNFFKSI